MQEKPDPYFEHRRTTAGRHNVMRSVEIALPSVEIAPNKELPGPTLEETIEGLGWSDRAVDNIIEALEHDYISCTMLDHSRLHIDFRPLTALPALLGHVSELDIVRRNLQQEIFGSCDAHDLTYLQTADFVVEGNMDDEREGKLYGRVYVDAERLQHTRNVYLDPESLHVTEYEFGHSFCVQGGIPRDAIVQVDVVRAGPQVPGTVHCEETASNTQERSSVRELSPEQRLYAYLEAHARVAR